MSTREPIFNVPAVTLGILALFILIHAGQQFLGDEAALNFILSMAFIPARYDGEAAAFPGGETAAFTSPFTHMLMHADIVHLAINSAWLLAFGSVLNKRMGGARFLAFSVAGGLAGVLLFYVMQPHLMAPVIGASGAVAAMMGGVLRFLMPAIDREQGYLLRQNPAAIPRMSLLQAVQDRRVILASIIFVAINLLAIVGFGTFGSAAGSVAWEAHLGGYAFGLLCFGLFDIASQQRQPYPPEVE